MQFETGQFTHLPELHAGRISCVALNHCDGSMVTAGNDGRVCKRTITGEKILEYANHLHNVTSLDLSPNGSLLATGGKDVRLQLSNAHDGTHYISWYGLEERNDFLITSPEDEYAKQGWFYTNVPHLINVLDYKDDHLPQVTQDEKRQEYLEQFHSKKMVCNHLNDFDRYQSELKELIMLGREAVNPVIGSVPLPSLPRL